MAGLTLHPASPWFTASTAIADGAPVDWRDLDREATTDEERELLAQLRVVAEIAALHRTLDDEPVAPPAARVIGRILPEVRPTDTIERQLATMTGQRWGNYELLEQVGAGAFGQVYRARDLTLDREVAVKLFRETESADRSVERMLAEGRTLAQVRHPNVVTVHGAESHDGRSGLCMEYVRGLTLEAFVKQHGAMSAREVALIGQDVCRALAAVHTAGLLHRDVKARNVMREEGGRVVLMDFGAGQPQGDPERLASRLTGTPLYLAPEVLNGHEASVRSDVYSLGVLLFFLATGDYPVRGGSLAEVRDAHRTGARTDLLSLQPTLPSALVQAIQRALEPNPTERVQSAGQLHVLLAEVLNLTAGQGLTCSRKRYWGIGLAAAAFIGAVVFGRAPITSQLMTPAATSVQTLAVLPFTQRDATAADEYLGSGLSEGIRSVLGQSPALEVRSPRNSSLVVGAAPPDLGLTLGVDTVVSGSYDVRGNAVAVSYAVTDTRRRLQLAGGDLVFAVDDLLSAREQLASAVMSTLERVDRAAPAAQAMARPTTENAALQDFLRGSYELGQFWQQPSQQRLQMAERHLLLAVEKDPQFTLALLALAKLRWVGAFYGYGGERELDAAAAATERALAINSRLGDAHAVRALVDLQRGNLDEARARLRLAATYSPAAAMVHYAAGFYFMGRGLADQSVQAFARAQELEPDLVRRELGFAYQYAGDLERSSAQYRDDLTRHPGDLTTIKSLAFVLLGLGRVDQAAPLVAEAERSSPSDRGVRLLSAYLRVARGEHGAVDEWLQESRADYWSDGGSCANVAAVLAAAGRIDEAVTWLKRAGEIAMRSHPYVNNSPYFTVLRGSADFSAYAATLEQEWRTVARAEEQDPLLALRVAQE